jgi:L-ascorbate metabolism protein UlaG (beta-lactamase superfamily)
VNLGGSRLVKVGDGKPVEITVVFASHDSTMPRTLLSEAERKNLDADNVSLVLGPPSGYVIRFTNGLVVYLSGDTGMHTEMKTVVHDYHKANLMVLNLGYSALNAPAAGHIANDLVAPASVIVSHVNEAGSVGGKVKPLSHTAAFVAQVKGRPVYLALSGKTMEFDGSGKCVGGCQAP